VMPKAIGTKYSVKKCIPESYEQKEKPWIYANPPEEKKFKY
jgi:hypothetical protein